MRLSIRTSISLPLAIFLLALVPSARAATNDVYIAATAQGGNTGADCANAKVYTYFNTAGNWNASPSGIQIGPGTTTHICGTIDGGVGCANVLAFQNGVTNGSMGNPITLKWETNAIVQCDSTDGRQVIEYHDGSTASYLVLDGGTNGIVRLTRNGTAGGACSGGSCNQQHIGSLINISPCDHCEIKSLAQLGAYVHTKCEASSGCDTAIDDTQVSAAHIAGTDFSFHGNVVADCGWCLLDFPDAGKGIDHFIYSNEFYNMNHAFALAGQCDADGVYFYGNHLHDMDNWDTGTADAYHHDGIHGFCGPTGTITNFVIANNLFDGNEGECCVTAWIFLEGAGSGTPWSSNGTSYVFGNVVVGSLDLGNGQFSLNAGAQHYVYNNTFIAGGPSTGACIGGGHATSGAHPVYDIQNNVFQGCGQLYSINSDGRIGTVDYNLYGHAGGGNPKWGFSNYASTDVYATWKAACSCDSHSIDHTSSDLTNFNAATGSISTGFAGIGAGVNLHGIASGNLARLLSDLAGTLRPVSAPWDIGAFQTAGGGGGGITGTGGFVIIW